MELEEAIRRVLSFQTEYVDRTVVDEEELKETDLNNYAINMVTYTLETSIPRAVVEEKLKSRIASVDKCYKKEIEPYQTEYGLNITLLNKREKEELINKRNCLLVQKHCYEEILEELLEEE